ncbi:hypothetical protein K461DRAFT_269096 [Myriangium duriaei CBS 260.36]|uniref:SET domain-containing protein n=1 Tax=Myriangium duriaei CBS 260.36 TaxID=1168546 RepID=A0A9P4J2G1_9PEZI|nr:hypothetical protein K461DRAFT_269096 [Myriangium duriaei CBS 260.36]
MTEALSLATSVSANQRPPISTTDFTPFHHNPPPPTLQTEETADDDDGEIACICAFNEDDGNTIQCDKCLRWQHISCYYPPPKEVPGEDQKHYCSDCVPQPDLDSRRATERQRRLVDQKNGVNGVKRPAAKASKKKVKDSPSLSAQTNGWSDRHSHIHNHDRKSASPRDQPPPAKKPKTSHRSSNSVSNPSSRKRAGTVNAHPMRSPSKSPELNVSSFIPQYSDDFLHLFQPQSPQVETDTNLMNNIAVTNLLSDWLQHPDAVKGVTGLPPSEIFKRWDGQVDDIPGRPLVNLEWVEDQRFTTDDLTPRWARLTVEEQIAQGTFIGELRGRVGLKDDYIHETDGRWNLLHHPEPFVFFHPQLPICIDARQEGSFFRFVRRSCQPNAELQTIITEGTEYHFCFMATREIMAGEEVTVAWQVPDTIRARINSSLATSNNFQPKVREQISTWVSNVLSNCGPCACNFQSTCLMAHYDRRGLSPPLPPAKPAKRKKKLPTLDPVVTNNRSRSASEVRKTEQDEDRSESRSVSDSRGSASRDITPSTHYSAIVSAGGFQELSERERKKLMREEEMFKRQEEESGRQKKKRNSGGSSLNTPSAASSVRSSALDGNKRPRGDGDKNSSSLPNGTSSRYADAGTSNRPQLSSRSSSGKRKAGSSSKLGRRESTLPTRAPSANYVDAAVQCDLDEEQTPPKVANRPRKRYISVTQRLFQRCISNNLKINNADLKPGPPTLDKSDAMDVDSEYDPSPAKEPETVSPPTTSVLPPDQPITSSPGSLSKPEDEDTVMADVEEAKPPQQTSKTEVLPKPISPTQAQPQVADSKQAAALSNADEVPRALQVVEGATQSQDRPPTPPLSSPDKVELTVPLIAPPFEHTDPPRMDDTQHSQPPKDSPSEKATPLVQTEQSSMRPTMHLEMPPPHLSITATQPASASLAVASSAPLVQSPTATTPGPASASLAAPLFSPNVAAAVLPSPIRKKLSLSDYTKRSKARESGGGETSTTSSLGKELGIKDDVPSVSATSSQDSDAAKAANEEAIVDDEPVKDVSEQDAKQESIEAQVSSVTDGAAKTDIPASEQAEPAPTVPAAAMDGGEASTGGEGVDGEGK